MSIVWRPGEGRPRDRGARPIGRKILFVTTDQQRFDSLGVLYDLTQDPLQHVNRWDDPACAAQRADLVADLYDTLRPLPVCTLPVEAPA